MKCSPLVSLISSSFFRIRAKSCTIASDKSSKRFNSTSEGLSFAASPIYRENNQASIALIRTLSILLQC